MSDALEAWRRRLSVIRQALREEKNSAPTGGGGAPVPHSPEKPPDTPGTGIPPPVAEGVAPAPYVVPPPSLVRATTTSVKQLRAEVKREVRLNGPQPRTTPVEDRPKTRGDCEGGHRPCPLVGCRHHTALEVNDESGSLKLNHPDKQPEELTASCSLDIADAGEHTLEQVGQILNVTRERARQLEESALSKAEAAFADGEVRMFRGPCKAVDAISGRQCKLPAHAANVPHRHERGAFRLVAAEGQKRFEEKERLEYAAMRGTEVPHVG